MTGQEAREVLLSRTFVELADSLVADFDVIEMLTLLASRSVELLDVASAGILMADPNGRLRVIASSDEQVELLELFQLQNDEGPCLDCYRSSAIVCTTDVTQSNWPLFAAESLRRGYLSVCALPLRLREETLGCLNLFLDRRGALAPHDLDLAQALADMASISLMQSRSAGDALLRQTSLQFALNSRVVIEQAKGALAERDQISLDEAFSLLRNEARRNRRNLTVLCAEFVDALTNKGAPRDTDTRRP